MFLRPKKTINPIHNVNLRHTYKGLHCDIAVDFEKKLHAYSRDEIKENQVPIEVYCFDAKYWDVEVRIIDLPLYDYGMVIPIDDCIKFCEEWVDKKLKGEM